MNDSLFARTRGDLQHGARTAFGLHLCAQLLAVILLAPLLGWLANRLAYVTGQRVVSNFDLVGFVLSPPGAVLVLLVAALTIGLLFAEFAGLSWIAGHSLLRRPVSVRATLGAVLRRLPAILGLATLVFVRLLLLALPFLAVAAAFWFTRLADHDINFYLAENPPEWRRAKLYVALLALLYTALAVRQLLGWLYAVPVMLFEKKGPAAALARSVELTEGRRLRLASPLLVFGLALAAVALALALFGRELADLAFDAVGLNLRGVLPIVAVCLAVSLLFGLLLGALQLAGHQFLVTRMYAEQVDPARLALTTDDDAPRSLHAGRLALRFGVFALLGAVAATAWLLSQLELREDVAVTAHRGASHVAPENSLAAFRAAIDAGADYIELDVQRTADGRLAVVHDADLMRMAGDPRRIATLASTDLDSIDIGTRRDPSFAGERVPLLDEVIALARGHIRLNVELKYNQPDPDLAPAVVDLLRRENFLDQAVITSLDYAALRQVMALEPRLPTGHIVTAAVGDVARTEANFVSLNAARATPALLRRAHAAGKAVHVWTVNDPELMLRMIERGVDNVITDDPALLARVLRERDALDPVEILGLRLRVLFDRPPPQLHAPESLPAL